VSGPPRFRTRPQYAADQAALRALGAEVEAGARPNRLQPSQPDVAGSQGTVIRLPGANFPPAGAIPVDETGDLDIAPGAAGVILVTVRLPDNYRFRIAGIGFQADDDAALGFLTWSIFVSEQPAPGYPQMLAAVGSLRQLAEIFVLVGSSQTTTIRATIAAAAPLTYRYLCRVRGWYYIEKEAG
jgi:hypothetical protein